MIVLALAGAVLVGNDFHHGSLPFYLSKPIGRWHYVLGKCLAAGLFVNLLTTLPGPGALHPGRPAVRLADVLPRQLAGAARHPRLRGGAHRHAESAARGDGRVGAADGAAGDGVDGLFVLCRMLAAFLVDGQRLDPRWRLIDLWNDLYLVGLWCLGADREHGPPGDQPQPWEAAVVVGAGVRGVPALPAAADSGGRDRSVGDRSTGLNRE